VSEPRKKLSAWVSAAQWALAEILLGCGIALTLMIPILLAACGLEAGLAAAAAGLISTLAGQGFWNEVKVEQLRNALDRVEERLGNVTWELERLQQELDQLRAELESCREET